MAGHCPIPLFALIVSSLMITLPAYPTCTVPDLNILGLNSFIMSNRHLPLCAGVQSLSHYMSNDSIDLLFSSLIGKLHCAVIHREFIIIRIPTCAMDILKNLLLLVCSSKINVQLTIHMSHRDWLN